MARTVSSVPATIASGTALSGAVNIAGYLLAGIAFPAAWTTADVTLQTSDDGVTYRNVYDAAGTEVEISADADQHTVIDPDVTKGLGSFIKVRSGSASSPVNQAAARTVKLIVVAH